MMEPEPEETQEEMEELAAKAIRPSRRLSLDDLLASELASAAMSDPLSKIRHVCEALMLIGSEERKSIGITEDDSKEAARLYALALALQNTYVHQLQDSHGHVIDLYASIAWTFPQAEAPDWLEWANGVGACVWYKSPEQARKQEEIIKKIDHPLKRMYYITTHQCTVPTYRTLVARFATHAMPRAARLMRKIISLVSADAFLQTLRVLRGKRGKQVV